jgi:glutaredoxin
MVWLSIKQGAMMKKVFLLLSLLIWANVQAGELYRSIDKEGKVQYTDTPFVGTEDVQALKPVKEPVPEESLPYATKVASENFPVTLYTFPSCGSGCEMGRALLTKRGIPFTEKSLTRQEDIDAYRKASGDSRYPGLSVGNTWLKGFQAEQWNTELDYAGYPKKDMTYHPPVAPASAPQAAQ